MFFEFDLFCFVFFLICETSGICSHELSCSLQAGEEADGYISTGTWGGGHDSEDERAAAELLLLETEGSGDFLAKRFSV